VTPLTAKAQLDVLQCGRPAKVKAEFAAQLETQIYALTAFIKDPQVFQHLSVAQIAKLDAIFTDKV
jgi:cell division FtsZ-interacting protein ZapD